MVAHIKGNPITKASWGSYKQQQMTKTKNTAPGLHTYYSKVSFAQWVKDHQHKKKAKRTKKKSSLAKARGIIKKRHGRKAKRGGPCTTSTGKHGYRFKGNARCTTGKKAKAQRSVWRLGHRA